MENMMARAWGGAGTWAARTVAKDMSPELEEMQRDGMPIRPGVVPLADFNDKAAQGRAPGDAPPANGQGGNKAAPIAKVREYFPETMLWQPALITDDKGVAQLGVNFADSITTWRLSASANSTGGSLGGVNVPLKVFQDFFVDIDLPVNLTQNDEVAFPVAVYNYLKTPQTVKIELQNEPWFELLDGRRPDPQPRSQAQRSHRRQVPHPGQQDRLRSR